MTSLQDLSQVELAEPYAEMLEGVRDQAVGPRVWRERKLGEAHDLLALATVAPRMTVKDLNLADDLRALIRLTMPVPCRFGNDKDLVVVHETLLGLRYPRQAVFESLPGPSFVQVLLPMGVFHPSVSAAPIQHLCLGAQLPAGIRVRELVLMSYRALAMQDHTIDVDDPAGIFHAAAARWWQQNPDRIPLTEEPFLADVEEEAQDA